MICNPTRVTRRMNLTIRQGLAHVVVNQYKFLIDFQGLMYFDDQQTHKNPKNLIRDRKFIEKFYNSLKENQDQLKWKYRYVGQFWGERNYLRYAIAPAIYTVLEGERLEFSLGLTAPFLPELLYLDKAQQLCFPFRTDHTTLKGVFSNQLSSSLLPQLSHSQGNTILNFQGKHYQIPTLE